MHESSLQPQPWLEMYFSAMAAYMLEVQLFPASTAICHLVARADP